MAVLALDLGGTKMAAALVSSDGRLSRRRQVPTADDPWADLLALADDVLDGAAVDGVGVGAAGPMAWPEGVVRPLNTPGWRSGFPLRQRLSERFPDVPVRVHNDAVCVAAGEHWQGGWGVDDLVGVVVSTGVGGGVVSGGRLVDGASGNAGHIGHVVVEPDGPPCGCGGRGCLEAVARGPAVVARARSRGLDVQDGRELADLARAGEPVAVEELARAGRAVGRAFASAAALLDTRVIAVGGGFSLAGEPLWGPLREALAEHARLAFVERLRVEPARLGQDAGLVGAGALVLAGDRYWGGG